MNSKFTHTHPKLYIRCNASYNEGLGHFIRCLSLTQSIKSLFDITFVIQSCSPDIIDTLIQNDFKLKNINHESDWLDDIESNSFVLIDAYNFSNETKYIVKQKCKALICIDDDCLNYEYADYIINHAPNASAELYPNIDNNRLFLGLDYALLRKTFLQAAKNSLPTNNKTESELTICIGGSDPNNYSFQIVNTLQRFEQPLNINVILGSMTNEQEANKILNIQSIHKVKILKNLNEEQMCSVLSNSKSAIAPASTILLESICCNCSTFTFYYTKNQQTFHDYLVKNELVHSFGFLSDINLDSNSFIASFRQFYSSEINQVTNIIRNQIANSENNLKQAFDYIISNTKQI